MYKLYCDLQGCDDTLLWIMMTLCYCCTTMMKWLVSNKMFTVWYSFSATDYSWVGVGEGIACLLFERQRCWWKCLGKKKRGKGLIRPQLLNGEFSSCFVAGFVFYDFCRGNLVEGHVFACLFLFCFFFQYKLFMGWIFTLGKFVALFLTWQSTVQKECVALLIDDVFCVQILCYQK